MRQEFLKKEIHICFQVLKLSLVIGDAAAIRLALQECQEKEYGKTKAIASHCPTRWGITLMIALDILDTKSALRNLVERPDWKDLAKTSTNAGKRAKAKCSKACRRRRCLEISYSAVQQLQSLYVNF
jgi:hypothetical protein